MDSVNCRMLHTTMPLLTKAPNLAIATLWAEVTTVQRQYLSGVAGELPPDQCMPEVWFTHPEQEAQARDLLYHLQHVPPI